MVKNVKQHSKKLVINVVGRTYALTDKVRFSGVCMATVISDRRGSERALPSVLVGVLPAALYFEVECLVGRGAAIEEIRLRTGRRAFVSSAGRNVPLDYVLDKKDMESIVDGICEGSVYAHADTISCGYLTLEGGVRVGIVGRATVERGKIIGVYDVSALCIRIPHRMRGVGGRIAELIRDGELDGGVLIFSPPGEGKTTLLRSLVRSLSSGSDARRVAVVDERGELGAFLEGEGLCVDVLSGYPKAIGIEIAARSMSAQLIICDEIGSDAEVGAIIAAQNCGVPLVASAHADSICGLLRRTGIRALHRAAVFGAYVGIRREAHGRDFEYLVVSREEADEFVEDSGGGDGRGVRNNRLVRA